MRNVIALPLTFLIGAVFLPLALAAQERDRTSPASSLPDGAIGYVEIAGLGDAARGVGNSEILKWFQSTDEFRQLQEAEAYRAADAARGIAEVILGDTLPEAVAALLEGEVGVAFYPNPDDSEKPHAVGYARLPDTPVRNRVRWMLKVYLSRSMTELRRPPGGEGSGIWVWGEEDKGFVAVHPDWIVASPQRSLVDRALALIEAEGDGGTGSLAKESGFAEMEAGLGGRHHARAYFATAMLAQAKGPRFGLPQQFDDGVASFLFGGILELAAGSPFAGLALDLEGERFHLVAAVAGDPVSLPAPYGLYFSAPPESGVIELPRTEGMIAGLTFHRKLGDWYRQRDALLAEPLLPAFDKFETDIGNLLPQKDFGEDVLPLIGDNFTLVAALQDFDHLDGEPGLQLPGFAAILDLADPEKGADMFQLFFQTLTSVLNIQAGQEGRQPWLLETEIHHDSKVSYARYLDRPSGERLPVVFNFQPAAAGVGRKYILATSVELCRDLVDHFKNPSAAGWQPRNEEFALDFAALATLAERNEGFLRSQEIQKGTPPDDAARRMELLILGLKQLEGLRFYTETSGGLLRAHLEASWKNTAPAPTP